MFEKGVLENVAISAAAFQKLSGKLAMMIEERSAFGDQQQMRRRATAYFALFEALRNQPETTDAWERLKLRLDPAEPFEPGIASVVGRLDIDDAALLKAYKTVAVGTAQLAPSDLVLELGAAGYPARLAATADAAPFLFVRQDTNVIDLPSISIVGTREASEAGRARAFKLAQLLVKRGIAVCSGLAAGIDAASHRGALEVGGITIAVVGTPLTRYYPKENRELQNQIGGVGAVVSQFHPSSKTLQLCFPLRNATMSALSLGTVVMEASETSGALIQARKALQQGRELFIPRSAIENDRLQWPKKFAERGAHVFSTIDELMNVLEERGLVPRRELATFGVGAAVGIGAS